MEPEKVFYDSGELESETYRNEFGLRHRPCSEGPAKRIWNIKGLLLSEEFYENGKLHNDNGPSVRNWNNFGLQKEWYHLRGKKHNTKSPSRIWETDGSIIKEEWYKDDKLHHETLPAKKLCKGGIPKEESWYLNGELHNEKGPAIIKYFYDGDNESTEESWYYKGVAINTSTEKFYEQEILKLYEVRFPFKILSLICDGNLLEKISNVDVGNEILENILKQINENFTLNDCPEFTIGSYYLPTKNSMKMSYELDLTVRDCLAIYGGKNCMKSLQ